MHFPRSNFTSDSWFCWPSLSTRYEKLVLQPRQESRIRRTTIKSRYHLHVYTVVELLIPDKRSLISWSKPGTLWSRSGEWVIETINEPLMAAAWSRGDQLCQSFLWTWHLLKHLPASFSLIHISYRLSLLQTRSCSVRCKMSKIRHESFTIILILLLYVNLSLSCMK